MIARSLEGAARRAPRRGFTLIELTLAIVLLAIGLLALVGAFARALQETQAARLKHVALRHVESVADSLALAGSAGPGTFVRDGFVIAWQPEACVAGACVRVRAVPPAPVSADTVAVLAAVGSTIR